MEQRTLGRTGLTVSAIGFGGIKLPQISEEEAAACLDRALDLGVSFIDTARNYRDSERKIGAGLKLRRGEFILATKSSARSYDGALADLETSLRELQFDSVDLWQLHSVSSSSDWEETMGPNGALKAARRAQEQGMVRHVGITIHRDTATMRKAIASGEFETIMLAYNPLDGESVADILPLAKAAGMGTIIMKALSGGQIAYPKQARQAGLGGPDALVAGSLRWALSDPAVDCVIPGMQAVHEVEENVALVEPFVPLSDAERQELVRLFGGFGGEFRYGQRCLRCGYCQPCPHGVDVPVVLHAATIVAKYPDDLKQIGREMYAALEVGAEACTECRVCIGKCPAALPVPELVREALSILS
jgi:uncharacterized protein